MTPTMEEYLTRHIPIIHILEVQELFVSSVYMFQILNLRFQYISNTFTYAGVEEIVQKRNI